MKKITAEEIMKNIHESGYEGVTWDDDHALYTIYVTEAGEIVDWDVGSKLMYKNDFTGEVTGANCFSQHPEIPEDESDEIIEQYGYCDLAIWETEYFELDDNPAFVGMCADLAKDANAWLEEINERDD